MAPPLEDDSWTRRGISLLWDADGLNRLCNASQVVSLRHFLRLHDAGWPEEGLQLVNDHTLVVAGLEACIDALPPDEAVAWLEGTVYPAIVSYQREVADGGSQAALVFWLVEHDRLQYRTSDDAYYWHCSGEFKHAWACPLRRIDPRTPGDPSAEPTPPDDRSDRSAGRTH